jgi:ArsR family transcriptional regulator
MMTEIQSERSIHETLATLFDHQERNIERAVRCLRVMAHPARLKILCVLQEREHSVKELERFVGVPQATLSQHLALLKDLGIVASRREGSFSIYRVADPAFVRLFDLVKEIFCD